MTSKSSKRWLKEHFSDPYVKKAKQLGHRSRAIFKLEEIAKRDKLFKPGMVVVDLGAAPGGWSLFVLQCVKPTGRVIALDLLPITPIDGVEIIQGDFSDESVLKQLEQQLGSAQVDWVLSDMAPNTSGQASIDVPRSIDLAELALDFARRHLKPGGGCLIKVFQGDGFDELFHLIKHHFKTVSVRKPKASRSRSCEVYLLAKELKSC
ncbi:MAG: 23S rRNA methyltransferase [Gammaproteobacteria bacterium RIFCSPHIGHO2_12_FULL_38_14]|nr:MAG: 23S rRNA methyltransferase [Gammaproteobacteria bacterium RIFCSPHIGHO2_12_FULL_38_14]